MKKQILKQIDELKTMVEMEDWKDGLKSFEEVRYQEWVDELMGRKHCFPIFCNHRYAEYQTIKAMVDDLYYKKNDSYEYHKNKPEIREMIAEIVAMTLFYKEQI